MSYQNGHKTLDRITAIVFIVLVYIGFTILTGK